MWDVFSIWEVVPVRFSTFLDLSSNKKKEDDCCCKSKWNTWIFFYQNLMCDVVLFIFWHFLLFLNLFTSSWFANTLGAHKLESFKSWESTSHFFLKNTNQKKNIIKNNFQNNMHKTTELIIVLEFLWAKTLVCMWSLFFSEKIIHVSIEIQIYGKTTVLIYTLTLLVSLSSFFKVWTFCNIFWNIWVCFPSSKLTLIHSKEILSKHKKTNGRNHGESQGPNSIISSLPVLSPPIQRVLTRPRANIIQGRTDIDRGPTRVGNTSK